MLNNRTMDLGSLGTRPFWTAVLLLNLLFVPIAHPEKQVHYKKQTTVDFEDALIEGKSRKPYSAYLSKQKSYEMRNLFDWDLDWEHRVGLSREEAIRR
jgi:hypothetical protein